MVKSIASGDFLSENEISNHIKIYAGPGAGKTHFLVENVKNIVSTNKLITNGARRKVLCITYTNKAVDEIVNRLQEFNDYVESYTIHGFIIEHIIKPFQSDLIRLMEEDFSITVSKGKPITSQVEGLGLLHGFDRELIYNYINLEKDSNDTYSYSKKNMSDVQVDIDKFINSLRNEETLEFCLNKPKSINFDDLLPLKKYIWSEARKLTHDEILYFGYRIVQTNPLALYVLRVKFPFIFVDEFQDTNPLQTQLIKLIGEKSTKIIVVGDIAQSIYSFQGAKISDFIDFNIDGEIQEYAINGNRRSTVNIVNFCNFIRQSDRNIWQVSQREYEDKDKDKIEAYSIKFLLGNTNVVNEVIATALNEEGVVLTRGWADAFYFIRNIKDEQSKLLKNIYNSYYYSPIQIRDEIREHNNVSWVKAFKFIFKLWESYNKKSFADIVLAFNMFSPLKISKIEPHHIFLIGNLSQELFTGICPDTLTTEIINKYNNLVIEEKYIGLRDLFDKDSLKIIIFSEYDRDDLVKNIELLEWETSYRLFHEVFSENSRYMTVHQAKGLEWEKVIVSVSPNSFDKKDGANLGEMFVSPKIIDENASDEFTRLFYVACSRAMDELFIHLDDHSLCTIIKDSLDKFQMEKGAKINYEFIL
ncbi:MAG: UvrD-helicase domain-containing protein [Candidatus Scatomorpha sp.]|jgi:DNA helicase-2/ATP-dependent DNA helicase PcrA